MFSFVLALLAFLLFYDSFTVLMGWGFCFSFFCYIVVWSEVRVVVNRGLSPTLSGDRYPLEALKKKLLHLFMRLLLVPCGGFSTTGFFCLFGIKTMYLSVISKDVFRKAQKTKANRETNSTYCIYQCCDLQSRQSVGSNWPCLLPTLIWSRYTPD